MASGALPPKKPQYGDTDRLFSMLPYKTLFFSKIKGRHGTYALIDKGENRDREIRKPRPSIRAQLKADKAKTAPKKVAAKTKITIWRYEHDYGRIAPAKYGLLY